MNNNKKLLLKIRGRGLKTHRVFKPTCLEPRKFLNFLSRLLLIIFKIIFRLLIMLYLPMNKNNLLNNVKKIITKLKIILIILMLIKKYKNLMIWLIDNDFLYDLI